MICGPLFFNMDLVGGCGDVGEELILSRLALFTVK
jgi:hypothetical protein